MSASDSVDLVVGRQKVQAMSQYTRRGTKTLELLRGIQKKNKNSKKQETQKEGSVFRTTMRRWWNTRVKRKKGRTMTGSKKKLKRHRKE